MSVRPAPVSSPAYVCDLGTHVFPTEKYAHVHAALEAAGELEGVDVLCPAPPSRDVLASAHDEAYLDDLEALRWTPRTQYSELPLTREIVDAFALGAAGRLLAAGAALPPRVAAHPGGGPHHAHPRHA